MLKPTNIILSLLVIGVVFASGCVAQGPQDRNSNMSSQQYSNEKNPYPSSNYTSSQMQGNGSGPTIGRVDTGGYPLIPLNTCPDKILSQNASQPKTILLGTLNGTTYAMQGDDWIRANCDPNLWIFEEARNMTKEDYLKLLPSCGSNYTLLSIAPVDVDKIVAIVPLGALNPIGGHVYPTDHVYFYGSGTAFSTGSNLYSPGNGWIVEIRSWDRSSGVTDYTVDFAPCREVLVRFDHVSSISQKLKDTFVAPYDKSDTFVMGGSTRYTNTKIMNISVSAGEVLGVAGGDWGTYDKRNTNVFANLARYIQYDYSNATCPIDYYTADIKASLQAKLGKYDGTVKRTIAPMCGQVAQDVPNTAQGIWVIPGRGPFEDVNQENYQLALVHDNIDPSVGTFVMGPSVADVPTSTYTFTPISSGLVNRDFKDVKADGNVYCYDVTTVTYGNTVNSFIIQLTSPTTLRIARHYSSCGSGPWSFSQYTDFER